MRVFKYIGSHPDLQGETALGRYCQDGHFRVQLDGEMLDGRPQHVVDGADWCYGWHESPRQDWTFMVEPKFRGSRDEVAEFIQANRFTLQCDVFHDDTEYVVFGNPLTE